MQDQPRIIIVGATSAIAEHCARLWVARQPVDLVLLGRDSAKLQRLADDLQVRSPGSRLCSEVVDFFDASAIAATVERLATPRAPDLVLIAHGDLSNQQHCQTNLAACRAALDINGVSPVLFAEAFATVLARANRGTLALIGSVAGDRARRANYVYGAAKGMVAGYAQGLQHRFAASGVKVVLIKPGPTDTPMTAEYRRQGMRLASVEQVARQIVRAIDRGQAVVYAPGRWRWIMWLVRHLPTWLFNRINV